MSDVSDAFIDLEESHKASHRCFLGSIWEYDGSLELWLGDDGPLLAPARDSQQD